MIVRANDSFGSTQEIFWTVVTGPQGEDAYVSFLQESGHNVVRKKTNLARVHSSIDTLLLRSKFCLVPPFQVFGLASLFDWFALTFA